MVYVTLCLKLTKRRHLLLRKLCDTMIKCFTFELLTDFLIQRENDFWFWRYLCPYERSLYCTDLLIYSMEFYRHCFFLFLRNSSFFHKDETLQLMDQ